MRIVVAEVDGDRPDLETQWARLVASVAPLRAGLVVLPEMPFSPWLAATTAMDPLAWERAAADHERWVPRLGELGAEVVVTTRPIVDVAARHAAPHGTRYNEGIVWVAGRGIVGRHRKTFLPDEPGFFEASWYERGPVDFAPIPTPVGAVGMMICTELWFTEHARALGAQGITMLAVPRATPVGSVEKWVAGAQVTAVTAGAYCLSTNRAGGSGDATFGSGSVIVDPEGVVLARTTPSTPVAIADVDVAVAQHAKTSYPRYVDTSPR